MAALSGCGDPKCRFFRRNPDFSAVVGQKQRGDLERDPKTGRVAEQGSSWQPLAEGHEVFDRVPWAGLLQMTLQSLQGVSVFAA